VPHYVIDVHHNTHTCPNDGTEHVVHTRRTLVATEPGGPCTRPVRVTSGDRTVMVACARAVPAPQQCPACRVTLTVRHTTTTPLEHRPRTATPDVPVPAPSGYLRQPCRGCGERVAASTVDIGRHLLCPSSGGAR
jgi:hypothetical protein